MPFDATFMKKDFFAGKKIGLWIFDTAFDKGKNKKNIFSLFFSFAKRLQRFCPKLVLFTF
jgi:hypothetical protein